MDHILCKIKGVKEEDIKAVLAADSASHAREGLMFRHLWHNIDDPDEILFIFTAADLGRARKFINDQHSKLREENPDATMPEITYLKGIELNRDVGRIVGLKE
jgi:hypothetical protein